MPTKFVFVTFIVILLLAACGGGAEPAGQESDVSTTGDTATAGDNEADGAVDSAATGGDESVSETAAESDADPEESDADVAGESVDSAADAGSADAADELPDDAVAGRPASGTDPDTGMAINPDTFVPGDEFIVRGTIISMTLTPTTSPEFLIEAPSGRKYRISSQDLAETFFDDGAQLRPHEYRQGMLAQATVSLAPDAGPTDILRSEDLTLLRVE